MKELLKRSESALTFLSITAIVSVMLIVCVDTAMRYILNAPLPWSYEFISSYLLVAGIHFAVSDTFRHGDHIGVDLMPKSTPVRVRLVVECLWVTAAIVVFALMAWGAAEHSWSAWQGQDFIPGYFAWPIWPAYLPIALGSGLLTLRLVQHLLALLSQGENPEVSAHGETLE